MQLRTILVAAVAVVGLYRVPAFATGVCTFTGLAAHETVDVNIFSNQMNGVGAGLYMFNTTAFGNILTVCADLLHQIHNGDSWNCDHFNTQGFGGGIELAGNIVAQKFAGVVNAATDQNAQACGLNLAVWDAIYDGGAVFDAANGNFLVTNASASALGYAAIYYTAISTSGNAIYMQPDPLGAGQGQLTVPEPTSIAALAIGALALRRRRRA